MVLAHENSVAEEAEPINENENTRTPQGAPLA